METVLPAPQHQPHLEARERDGGWSSEWEGVRPHIPVRGVHTRKCKGRNMDGETALPVEEEGF